MAQTAGARKIGEQRRCQPAPAPIDSELWRAWDQQLAAEHLARRILAALPLLDLQPLWDSYSGCGSLPHSPERMLAMVLFEKQRGRVSPSQWHRDQQESVALLWLGEGIQPARSAWYNFRQRLSPFLERWNQQILHLAIVQGITAAMEAVTDGTLIAASASRHRLLNQEQMTTRLKALEAACEADLENQPLEKKVAGWP